MTPECPWLCYKQMIWSSGHVQSESLATVCSWQKQTRKKLCTNQLSTLQNYIPVIVHKQDIQLNLINSVNYLLKCTPCLWFLSSSSEIVWWGIWQNPTETLLQSLTIPLWNNSLYMSVSKYTVKHLDEGGGGIQFTCTDPPLPDKYATF